MESGLACVRVPAVASEVQLPFGGMKATGGLHKMGCLATDFSMEGKAIHIDDPSRPS